MKNEKRTEWLLRNYKIFRSLVESMEDEVRQLEGYGIIREDGVKAIRYDILAMGSSNKVSSPSENAALKNLRRIEYLKCQINMAKTNLNSIDRVIDSLGSIEKEILKSRYIENLSWKEVSLKTNFSIRWCNSIGRKSLQKVTTALGGGSSDLVPILCTHFASYMC